MQKRLSLLLCSPLLALATSPVSADEPIDVVLIGGGIMSATLGTYLQELVPEWDIHLYERLGEVAQESSNAWNNAGSGHSAFMEMNCMELAFDQWFLQIFLKILIFKKTL